MSQENIDLVRRWVWAFENDRDAFRDTLHPEIEWRPFEESHTPSHGHEGALRIRDEWLATWDEHRIELEEVVDKGDSVVASLHVTARGGASGVEVDVRLYGHFKVRDGRVVYLYEHEDKAEALEAAGQRE